jgi:hypothetical protein
MHRAQLIAFLALCVAGAQWACASTANTADEAAPAGDSFGRADDAGISGCLQDSNCPSGLTCVNQVCVTTDGLPPEQKDNSVFLQPQSSAHLVFALAPADNSVAVIDPSTLAIQSITLPAEPNDLALIPGQDAAVIVSLSGQSVSYLSCVSGSCTVTSQRTARQYPAVTVSPDGQWALVWTPDGQVPADGVEGIVGVVSVAALAEGTPSPILERQAGRRETNVFFQTTAQGQAVNAVIAGQETVDIIDLTQFATDLLPQSIAVPSDYAEDDTREVAVAPDGSFILFSSLSAQNIGVFMVATAQFQQLPLPGTPTDIEINVDGSMGVAVMRGVGQVAWFPLPGVLTNASELQLVSVSLPGADCPEEADGGTNCTVSPGQAVISPDGTLAALFTNVSKSKSFAVLDLTTGVVTPFTQLQKLVQAMGIGPDGNSVVVLHVPDANSMLSDNYEQTVATSEGFSVVDLSAGQSVLTLTQAVPPQFFVFAGDQQHAAVTLNDTTDSIFGVDTIDLQTLVVTSITLASSPEYAGTFANTGSKIWVEQNEAVGRMSFIDLSTGSVQTATGYDLNSGIQP